MYKLNVIFLYKNKRIQYAPKIGEITLQFLESFCEAHYNNCKHAKSKKETVFMYLYYNCNIEIGHYI